MKYLSEFSQIKKTDFKNKNLNSRDKVKDLIL